MRATIRKETHLPNLPSASGVEIIGDTAYVIGDDSPFLYSLDARSLHIGQSITLFETAHFSTGRIPKAVKLDLECLTALTTTDGETGLLACGSGATAAREQGFWVTLPAGAGQAATVYPLALSNLYAALRSALPQGITLNLEAVAATATELWFFQRTVGAAAGNIVFRLPLAVVLDAVRLRTAQAAPFQQQAYTLPAIDGKPAGFSGATFFDERLFISASVEDTTDPVADGEVLGSFVGVLPAKVAPTAQPQPVACTQLVWPDGKPYRGKVESVTVRRRLAPGRYELLLVTDDDAGGSTAVEVELEV